MRAIGVRRVDRKGVSRVMNTSHGIDVTTLRLLLAAVDEGNLGRAAARENIAVSAISRRISDLEIRLGVKLLERHDRGVRSTAATDAVIDRIRTLLGLLDQVAHDLHKIRGGKAGFIRIQAHMSAAVKPLYEHVAAFMADNGDIEIQLDETTSLEVLHAVRVGTCDLGLVSGTVDAGDLCLIPWSSDELVALIPPGCPLLENDAVSLSQLAEYPFIGMQRDSALLALYRTQSALAGVKLRERSHASSFESVRRMVDAGLGVAILPGSTAHPFARQGGYIVRPLAESWAARPLMLCVRDMRTAPIAVRSLIEFLIKRTEDI